MRHYCPNVPICLTVDGDFDVSDLEEQYDLIVLRVPELPSEQMRKMMCGNYRAKLAALWEGPFEFYVWLDSDAIVWGDFTATSPHRRRFSDFLERDFHSGRRRPKSRHGCRIFISIR